MNASKFIYQFLTVSILITAGFACSSDDDDNGNVNPPAAPTGSTVLDMRIFADGNDVERGDLFSINNDYDFRILETRFYVSNFEFQNTNGDWIDAEPNVLLLDVRDQGTNKHVLDIPEGDYVAMRYLIGLDSATNRMFPTDFPREHPLSAFQATHWNWNLFYRFIIVEGRVNTYGNFAPASDTTRFNIPLSIHPGTDDMLVEKETQFNETLSVTASGTNKRMIFSVNVNDWVSGPGGEWDPLTENQGHAEPHDYEQTKKFGANFGASVSVHVE